MNNKISLFAVIILCITLLSCNLNSNDDNVQRSRISDVLYRIEDAFNQRNNNAIMQHYHQDFLHNGMNHNGQSFIWSDRMTLYNILDIEIVSIELDGYLALVRMKLSYSDRETKYPPFFEPETSGDLSYFFHERGEWKIYGNQIR